jgi:signal transduction histidine kinase
MDGSSPRSLASNLAAALRESRNHLTGRWLERLAARVDLELNRVFPTDDLLDHMPLLIGGIADDLEDAGSPIRADSEVVHRAMELGAMRHRQGFDEYEVLKEFEILGGILFTFLTEHTRAEATRYPPDEVFACTSRVFRALSVVQQAAVAHYVRLMKARVSEREERLRGFNRALTHEFRNRIGAAMGASQILDLPSLDDADRTRLTSVISANMQSMQIVLDNLLELTALEFESRQQRHVRLPEAVRESVRQLRDMAMSRGVAIQVVDDMPEVEVPAAAVELSLTNLISNAIKYADGAAAQRWVRLSCRIGVSDAGEPCEVTIDVSDNGIGVPPEQRERLFERLFRAANAESSGVEGTGLGLSIVRETIEALGGRVSASFTDSGSSFSFSLPCRRLNDQIALGAHGVPAPRGVTTTTQDGDHR